MDQKRTLTLVKHVFGGSAANQKTAEQMDRVVRLKNLLSQLGILDTKKDEPFGHLRCLRQEVPEAGRRTNNVQILLRP